MIGKKVTLVAATATNVASSPAGGNYTVKLKSALTDIVAGGPNVSATVGYAFAAAVAGTDIFCGRDDLWLFSTTGGDVFLLYPENA